MATLYSVNPTLRKQIQPADGKAFTLEEMQSLVGGYVESLHLIGKTYLLFNEDGIRLKLPVNRAASHLAQCELLGNVLVCLEGEIS